MPLVDRELVMHKLRGEHEFRKREVVSQRTGKSIITQTCKICGFKKKTITDMNYGLLGNATMSAFTTITTSTISTNSTGLSPVLNKARSSLYGQHSILSKLKHTIRQTFQITNGR